MAVIEPDTQQQRAPFTSTEEAQAEAAASGTQFIYTEWKDKCSKLYAKWKSEIDLTAQRRLQRKIEVDIDQLRKSNLLKADETLITARVIDQNINKEQASYVAYLEQSHRIGVFKCIDNPDVDTQNLEEEFTKKLDYPGMKGQHLKTRDGAALHGWDSCEITFDISKPGHCGHEHISHENLIFPFKSLSLQACPFIMRRFELTPVTLRDFEKTMDFDSMQVQKLLDPLQTSDDKMFDNIPIYKLFIKMDGIVYVGWLDFEKCTGWLRPPVPLFLGRRREVSQPYIDPATLMMMERKVMEDLPENFYPIVLLKYMDTEEDCITTTKGRAFYDLPTQEAQTALLSLYINGNVRASNVYASIDDNSGDGSPPKRIDVTLEHGCIYNKKMDFWSPSYPDPNMLRALNFLDVKNQQESGNVAAAVVNRQDARKTKAEIDAAIGEDASQEAIPMSNFSSYMQEALMYSWHIIQSQALQGLIPFLQVPVPSALGETLENDIGLIQLKYEVAAAGDIDVLKRKEKLARRFNIWPFVQGTPVQIEFIKDLIREMLPDDARKYIAILDSLAANKDQMLASMAQMLQALVTDAKGNIKPEFAQFAPQLTQMQSAVQQALSTPSGGMAQPPDAGNQQAIVANNAMTQNINNNAP